jgi:CheY-like chemotaxis protein
MAYSRKQIIEPTLLDLNTVISDMLGLLERLIGADVTIDFRPARVPALVVADQGQLEQVLMNLAVNAQDAMPNGGTLTLGLAEAGAWVVLTVSDTGVGMTADVQLRLFEPFFTTKEQGRGTGLGLATAHSIVARAGGTISVVSAPGVGTSFTVSLPAAPEGEMSVVTPLLPAGSWKGTETVLVVEDETGLRELMKLLLERQGYTVVVASNAEEGRRQFANHPAIDLLLTDIIMPGENGHELATALLEQRPELRVLYMSGYTAETISRRGILQPGIVLLQKPFSTETLGQKIREVFDR